VRGNHRTAVHVSPLTSHLSPLNWTLLLDAGRPGWQNMAIDSALLDLADGEGAAFLRLYSWTPYCLSFGRHEPATRRYPRAEIEARGLDCVRRPTGGRAVWHARELTYAVAAPLEPFGGLQAAYRRIHAMLVAALGNIVTGGQWTLADAARPLGPASGPCFSAPVGGEVLLGGGKVIGSAQLRQGNAFLQHGSVLLENDQSLLSSLAGLGAAPEGASLSAVLGRAVGFAEAADAIVQAAPDRLGPLSPETELPAVVAARAAIHYERFRDSTWTWQR